MYITMNIFHHLDKNLDTGQGRESRDLLRSFIPVFGQNGLENFSLFCVHSINFYGVKCRHLVYIGSDRLFKCFMLRAVFFHTTPFFARRCVEKYSVHENASYRTACC